MTDALAATRAHVCRGYGVLGSRRRCGMQREHAAQNECAGRSAGVRSEHSWCIGYGVSLTR